MMTDLIYCGKELRKTLAKGSLEVLISARRVTPRLSKVLAQSACIEVFI